MTTVAPREAGGDDSREALLVDLGTTRRAAKTRQRFAAPGSAEILYVPVTRKGNPKVKPWDGESRGARGPGNLASDEILSGVLGTIEGA